MTSGEAGKWLLVLNEPFPHPRGDPPFFALAAGFLKGPTAATPLKSSVYRHLS